MNYIKIYDSLIEKRRNVLVVGYSEKHHVIPKCMGGSNDVSNLVKLTAREHFIAHLLLAKIYGKDPWGAVNRMLNSKVHNSKEYDWARKKFSKSMMGKGNGRYGIPVSERTRKLISEANSGKPCPQHVKDTTSKLHTGRDQSPEERTKKSLSKNGRPINVFRAKIEGNKFLGFSCKKLEYLGTWQILRECARELKVTHSSIRRCLQGKVLFFKGYIFEWK